MKFESKLTIAVALFFVATIVCGSLYLITCSQYVWSHNFAEKHLNVAQVMSDAETQEAEISKAIDILKIFPKEGNFDLLNKNNPSTDMRLAWKALYQLKDYAGEVKGMNKTSQEYQLGIYNTQEKVSYFRNTFGDAFYNYSSWGTLSSYFFFLCLIFFIAWVLFFLSLNDTHPQGVKRFIAKFSLVGTICGVVIFIYLFEAPVLYTGPV